MKLQKSFESQDEKINYMTEAPVPGLIWSLSVPTIISMLVSTFYNMADTFFVGRINTQATAAVGVVFSVMAIIQAGGFFFGHGSGNYISRKLGERNFEEAGVMASVGFFSAFLCGILFMMTGLIFLKPFAVLLGSTPTILPYTISYLRIILMGAPFMMPSLVLNNQLRFQGNAAFAMVGIVAGAIINIGLDPLFIFVFDMGVAGAAAATVISQIISFCLLWIGSHKGTNIRITWSHFQPSTALYREVINGGFPSLCRQGLASISVMCLNQAAGSYSDAAIAGMSVVSRITMFANSALIGFGQGFQPVCGMNYGAKKYGRVREAFWFCVRYAAFFLIGMGALMFAFAPDLVRLFRRDDAEVVKVGAFALRLQCLTFPFNAWIVMCNMMLQSVGKGVRASLLAAARQGLFFLPLIFILPGLYGLLGVEMCQTVSDCCSMLMSIPLGLSFLQELKREDRLQHK